MSEKTRENRLRRMAKRQGLILQKSPRRDVKALDYGLFALVDASSNVLVSAPLPDRALIHGLTIDEVEEWLTA